MKHAKNSLEFYIYEESLTVTFSECEVLSVQFGQA